MIPSAEQALLVVRRHRILPIQALSQFSSRWTERRIVSITRSRNLSIVAELQMCVGYPRCIDQITAIGYFRSGELGGIISVLRQAKVHSCSGKFSHAVIFSLYN